MTIKTEKKIYLKIGEIEYKCKQNEIVKLFINKY